MFKKWIGIAATLALFVGDVYAACGGHSCVAEYVDRLYVNSDSGLVYVATSGDEAQLDCSAVSDVYVTLDLAEPGASAIYSSLLSAQVSNKKVQVRIVNGSAGCKVKYITIDRE
ncbi:MAG: hypothetical protein ACK4E7_04410 [Permianibacter sp.]